MAAARRQPSQPPPRAAFIAAYAPRTCIGHFSARPSTSARPADTSFFLMQIPHTRLAPASAASFGPRPITDDFCTHRTPETRMDCPHGLAQSFKPQSLHFDRRTRAE
jgi:hypothetical protein